MFDFDPTNTFTCGQAFRWFPAGKLKKEWLGIASGYIIRATNKGVELVNRPDHTKDFPRFAKRYFSLDDDMFHIFSSMPKDEYMDSAVKKFRGLRILTQDPWECLISFVCSINKNIPSIRAEIESLCRRFGEPIQFGNNRFFSFPDPKKLAKATKNEILSCNVGFRWKYIKFISESVASGELELESRTRRTYADAREQLISELSGLTFGVGPKVCDCELLFSFHKLEAFPIDVWMLRCIRNNYAEKLEIQGLVNGRRGLTPRTYEKIGDAMRSYFGEYAGYAQQYLYMKIRNDSIQNRALV